MRSFVLGVGAILFGAAAAPLRADVIFSEDFSGGNPANASDYTLVDEGAMTTGGDYRVVSNPHTDLDNNYGSVYDHTSGTADGEMLFFDGSTDSTSRIYYRSASLVGGVTYDFSFWQEADNTSSVPDLNVFANSTLLGTMENSSSQTWAQFDMPYTPPTSGTYTFSITDSNTVLLDNDGAVDDVSLVSTPEPAALGLMAVAAMLLPARRRRA